MIFSTRTPGSITRESATPVMKQTAATPAMIQFLLISKTPTNGHQFGQMRFGRVEWRTSENTGDPGECSDGRSTGTAETLPDNWQTTALSNRETDLRLAESTRPSSGAEPRGPCPCGGSDRASLDASCRRAIPMILPRLRSIAALRHAWKAVLPSDRNGRCCKQNEIGPHHKAQAAPPTRSTTAGCRASGRTNHGQNEAFLRCSLCGESEGNFLIARPWCNHSLFFRPASNLGASAPLTAEMVLNGTVA